MEEKVKHLEQSLCNAQSLIHKLVKFMDDLDCFPESHCGGGTKLPKELRARADVHIKLLLEHKRKEHFDDVARMRREATQAERDLEHQMRLAWGHTDALERAKSRLLQADKKLEAVQDLTDEDLLG
jgi:hypothetical protein